jgi:hypothetical protein
VPSVAGDHAERPIPVPLTWITAARRMLDDQVRQAAPQPFGLVGDSAPRPAFVGGSAFSGSATGGVPTPGLGELTSIALCYGIQQDPRSPYVEVLTDFTADHGDTVNLRIALSRAAAHGRQPDHLAQRARPPKGPLPRGRLQILVAGKPRTVTTTSYQNYSGLQFSHSGKTVTAIARADWPDLPSFAEVTDLERYLAR